MSDVTLEHETQNLSDEATQAVLSKLSGAMKSESQQDQQERLRYLRKEIAALIVGFGVQPRSNITHDPLFTEPTYIGDNPVRVAEIQLEYAKMDACGRASQILGASVNFNGDTGEPADTEYQLKIFKELIGEKLGEVEKRGGYIPKCDPYTGDVYAENSLFQWYYAQKVQKGEIGIIGVEQRTLQRIKETNNQREEDIKFFNCSDAPELVYDPRTGEPLFYDTVRVATVRRKIVAGHAVQKARESFQEVGLYNPGFDTNTGKQISTLDFVSQAAIYKALIGENLASLLETIHATPTFDPDTKQKIPTGSLEQLLVAKRILDKGGYKWEEIKLIRELGFEEVGASLESPPIQTGEHFVASEELVEILKLKGAARRDALMQFKDRLGYQRDGIVQLATQLIEDYKIYPDIPDEDIDNTIDAYAQRYGFNLKQREQVKDRVDTYRTARDKILKLQELGLDENALCYAIFGKRPHGEVKVSYGPMSVCFTFLDKTDYTRMFNWDHSDNNIPPAEKIRAETSGGAKFGRVKNTEYNHLVMASKYTDDYGKIVKIHEEQHVINNLFFGNESQAIFYDSNQTIWQLQQTKTFEESQKIIKADLRVLEKIYLSWAKDEVIAFFRDGSSIDRIRGFLTDKSNGLYDYSFKKRNGEYSQTFGQYDSLSDPFIPGLITEVLVKDYDQTLNNGLEVIRELQMRGYQKMEIINLLSLRRIEEWPKTVARQLQFRDAKRAA